MSTTLDKILMLSHKGYIDEPKTVRKTVQTLMNLTVKELQKSVNFNFLDFYEVLMEAHNIQPEQLYRMRYTELACLIDECYGLDYFEDYKYTFNLFSCRMLYTILQSASQSDIRIKRFLSLSVESFYEYLEGIRNNRFVATEYLRFKEYLSGHYGYQIEDSTTIADVLVMSNNKITQYRTEGNEYNKQGCDAHRVMTALLIDSFKLAYKEQFDYRDVLSKNRNALTL